MMESSTCMSMTISLVCILVVTVSWNLFKLLWLNPKRLERILREQGFQGNDYKFYVGDSKEMDRMRKEAWSKPMSDLSNDHISRSLPFYHHTVKNFGEKSFMWHGPIPMVNISEPGVIKEVLTKMNEFPKPLQNPLMKMLIAGLVELEGDEWAKRRKILNPAFYMEKLKFMIPAFFASASNIINKWEKMTSKTGSCEVDVYSYLHKLSADAISRAAFGSSYEEGSRIFELLAEQLSLVVPTANSVYFPGWRFVPTKRNRRIIQISREIKSLLIYIINKRQKAIQEGEKHKDDLLGILLESNHKLNALSHEEVIRECQTFYVAGQETTSTLLTWTFILLSKHQHWQKLAREEIFNAFGNNTPDFHGLNQLHIVTMILQEALRLYPPVSELPRRVFADIKIGDTVIPSGVLVNLSVVGVHLDEKLWGDDAKEFNPNRFREGVSKATKGNMCFFAFGWGPRTCIGSNFSMVQARLALALILRRFSFELSPSYVHAPALITTIEPQFGAQIIVKRLCM